MTEFKVGEYVYLPKEECVGVVLSKDDIPFLWSKVTKYKISIIKAIDPVTGLSNQIVSKSPRHISRLVDPELQLILKLVYSNHKFSLYSLT